MELDHEAEMKFVEIQFGTNLYAQELALREQFLRRPLGMALTSVDVKDENAQQHYGVLQKDILIACAVIRMEDAQYARLRQMVVPPDFRQAGVGSRMIANIEEALARKGVKRIKLHARLAAVPFYEKSGYQPEGEPFTEI